MYEGYEEGEGSPLEELPIQYADYGEWQREWLQGGVLEEQLSYWKKQLQGLPGMLELPTDRPRPALQSFRGAKQTTVLPGELAEGLKGLSRRAGTTLFMTLLAAFQVLLARASGQVDFAVGVPIANRNRVELEGLIGFFVNTLVMRSELSWGAQFPGAAAAGAGGGSVGVCAPGFALREVGGGDAAGAEPEPSAAVSGDV